MKTLYWSRIFRVGTSFIGSDRLFDLWCRYSSKGTNDEIVSDDDKAHESGSYGRISAQNLVTSSFSGVV
jgi:hypothetical protein